MVQFMVSLVYILSLGFLSCQVVDQLGHFKREYSDLPQWNVLRIRGFELFLEKL